MSGRVGAGQASAAGGHASGCRPEPARGRAIMGSDLPLHGHYRTGAIIRLTASEVAPARTA